MALEIIKIIAIICSGYMGSNYGYKTSIGHEKFCWSYYYSCIDKKLNAYKGNMIGQNSGSKFIVKCVLDRPRQ